jgi:hypothetical protein
MGLTVTVQLHKGRPGEVTGRSFYQAVPSNLSPGKLNTFVAHPKIVCEPY